MKLTIKIILLGTYKKKCFVSLWARPEMFGLVSTEKCVTSNVQQTLFVIAC